MKIVKLVPTIVTADDAIKEFTSRSTKIPYSVELIYLPFLLFKYHINMTHLFGKKSIDEGLFLVDMLQGIPINVKRITKFKISPDLQEEFSHLIDSSLIGYNVKNPLWIEEDEVEEKKVLPGVLEEDEAIKKGVKLLMYDIMKLSGAFRYRKVDIIPQPGSKMLYYPYWLVYYRNRKNEMQFAVLDALNKRIEGGQIIRSIKIALEKANKE